MEVGATYTEDDEGCAIIETDTMTLHCRKQKKGYHVFWNDILCPGGPYLSLHEAACACVGLIRDEQMRHHDERVLFPWEREETEETS